MKKGKVIFMKRKENEKFYKDVKGSQQKSNKGVPLPKDNPKDFVRRNPDLARKIVSKFNNDPKWYMDSPELVRDSGNINFNTPAGYDLFEGISPETGTTYTHHRIVPGIMQLAWIPTLGGEYRDDVTENKLYANIAFSKLYASMRTRNTSTAVYQANDLGMYLLACDAVYSWHATLTRLYKTIYKFETRNKYINSGKLVAATGFDVDNLRSNLARLRYLINYIAATMNDTLMVPKLSLFERHYWLNSHYWSDGDSDKSQVYVPVQVRYGQYTSSYATSGAWLGGAVKLLSLSTLAGVDEGHVLTIDDISNITDSLLNPLINDDDILIISADFKKYFKEEGFSLPMLADTIDPIGIDFSLEVLSQLQNIRMFNVYFLNGLLDFVQNPEAETPLVNQRLRLNGTTRAITPFGRAIVTYYNDSPSPEDIMVATRGTAVPLSNTSDPEVTVTDFTCGTELFVGWQIVGLNYTGSGIGADSIVASFDTSDISYSTDDGGLIPVVVANTMHDLAPFAMHPLMYVAETNNEDETTYLGILVDAENYTPVSYIDIAKLHRTAIFSEYGFYKKFSM